MFLFPLIFNKFLLFYLFTWYVVRNTYNKSVRVVFLSWTSEAISFIKTPTLVFSKTRFFSIEAEKFAFFTRMSIIMFMIYSNFYLYTTIYSCKTIEKWIFKSLNHLDEKCLEQNEREVAYFWSDCPLDLLALF